MPMDTGIVWDNPNLSDMIDERKMDVYIFIFSRVIRNIKKHSRIKKINKLTTKAHPKGYIDITSHKNLVKGTELNWLTTQWGTNDHHPKRYKN